MNKLIMTDGSRHETIFRVKSINPWAEDVPGVWSPDPTDQAKQAKSTRLVPSVFAGIGARVQAMSDLPFTIYGMNGDKPLDDSDNYKNVVTFLPNPSRFFGLSEMSLVAAGKAYWFKGTGAKTGNVKELKYWMPQSIELDPQELRKGNIKFKRRSDTPGARADFAKEEVLYLWLDDESVELGPPTVWPLLSAMLAAEASGAISKWVRDYMLRGAIKAMLLAVDGVPPPGEVQRMESWWNKFMTGTRGLVWKVFNMQNVTPTIVGDGLEALKDLSVKKDLRYEIHEALGTRHLLEDENYATAQARERQFYTQTVVPDARLIQQSFNDQILHEAGYHLEFEPERLEIFQVDEAERAESLSKLTEVFTIALAGPQAVKLSMEILGYDLNKNQLKLIEEGIAQKEKEKAEELARQDEQMEAQLQAKQPPKPAPNKAIVELDRWQRKADKAGKMVTWHAVDIPAEIAKGITDGEISFDTARAKLQGTEDGNKESEIKTLALSLDKLAEAYIKSQTVAPQPNINVTLPPITMTAQLPETKEPSITFAPVVEMPVVNVAVPEQPAPQVTVSVPEQPAPVVNVTNEVKPSDVKIDVPKPKRERQKVKRDKNTGLIESTDTEIEY